MFLLLHSKVCSPPYWCAVLLDPLLVSVIVVYVIVVYVNVNVGKEARIWGKPQIAD